jgi:hypothetical protein
MGVWLGMGVATAATVAMAAAAEFGAKRVTPLSGTDADELVFSAE